MHARIETDDNRGNTDCFCGVVLAKSFERESQTAAVVAPSYALSTFVAVVGH